LSEISMDYLQDKYLLIHWQQAIYVLIQTLKAAKETMDGGADEDEVELGSRYHKAFMNVARTYPRVGKQLSEILPNVARMGFLDEEILSGIGERMIKIDDMSKYLHEEQGDPSPPSTWFVLTLPDTYEIMKPELTNGTGQNFYGLSEKQHRRMYQP
jgi:hypothetical protein